MANSRQWGMITTVPPLSLNGTGNSASLALAHLGVMTTTWHVRGSYHFLFTDVKTEAWFGLGKLVRVIQLKWQRWAMYAAICLSIKGSMSLSGYWVSPGHSFYHTWSDFLAPLEDRVLWILLSRVLHVRSMFSIRRSWWIVCNSLKNSWGGG